jgi:hypothetical protein
MTPQSRDFSTYTQAVLTVAPSSLLLLLHDIYRATSTVSHDSWSQRHQIQWCLLIVFLRRPCTHKNSGWKLECRRLLGKLCKSKAVPLHTMEALGGRGDIAPTLGTRWGDWSASRPGRALTPGERTPVTHWTGETGWVSEQVWTQRLEEKSFAPAGDPTPIARSVVRHCTDWAIPSPW